VESTGPKAPSRAWFILPSLLLLVAVVLGTISAVSFVNFVRSDFVLYQPNSSISVTNDGFTLYAEEGSLGADDRLDIQCTVTGAGGQTPLRTVVGRTVFTHNDTSFLAVASTPANLPVGLYSIACETSVAGVDTTLFVGPKVDVGRVARLAVLGVVLPLFLGVSAVVLFAILGFLRYRARRVTPATPVMVSSGAGRPPVV